MKSYSWIYILQAQFLHPRATFPPPFGLIYYTAKMIYHWKIHKEGKRGQAESVIQKKAYLRLLKRLILTNYPFLLEKGDEDVRDLVKDRSEGGHDNLKVFSPNENEEILNETIITLKLANNELQQQISELQKKTCSCC